MMVDGTYEAIRTASGSRRLALCGGIQLAEHRAAGHARPRLFERLLELRNDVGPLSAYPHSSQSSVDAAVAKIIATTAGDARGFAGDLSKAEAAEELFRRHSAVDILINNLGIFEPKPFEEIPDAD